MVFSFSSLETWIQSHCSRFCRSVYKNVWDGIFLFKMCQIYLFFNVLWLQCISQQVWWENNKHQFHKLMSLVINSNSQTSLNSDFSYLALSHPGLRSALALKAGRWETGKPNAEHRWEVRRNWGSTSVNKIQSSSPLYAPLLFLPAWF